MFLRNKWVALLDRREADHSYCVISDACVLLQCKPRQTCAQQTRCTGETGSVRPPQSMHRLHPGGRVLTMRWGGQHAVAYIGMQRGRWPATHLCAKDGNGVFHACPELSTLKDDDTGGADEHRDQGGVCVNGGG